MPRSKPSRTEELRITLGTKERMMFEDLLTSYRIKAVSGENGVVDAFSDFGKVLKVAATVGGLLELFGITDLFDFDDEVRGLVLPTLGKLQELKDKRPPTGPLGDLLKELLQPFQR